MWKQLYLQTGTTLHFICLLSWFPSSTWNLWGRHFCEVHLFLWLKIVKKILLQKIYCKGSWFMYFQKILLIVTLEFYLSPMRRISSPFFSMTSMRTVSVSTSFITKQPIHLSHYNHKGLVVLWDWCSLISLGNGFLGNAKV